MAGIYGIFSDSPDHRYPYYEYLFSSSFDRVVNEQFTPGSRTVVGRSSLNKFPDDRFAHTDGNHFFLNEGILLNYDRRNLPAAFIRDYREKRDMFFHRLAGSYCGLIVSDDGNKICLYNDFMGTRPLYFFHDPDKRMFAFSSELKFFRPLFKKTGVDAKPDELAWKELSVNGYLFGDHTLIKGVRKLPRNSLLFWDGNENRYSVTSQGMDLDSSDTYPSDQAVFDAIEERMTWSVRASREKDISYGYCHYQALSGGLDSRFHSGLAHHLGYTDAQTLTFSQSGTDEERCARDFAKSMGMNQQVVYLDGGDYLLTDLMDAGLSNDGLVMIHGAAHLYHNIRKTVRPDYGMFHTGQIGGAVFGTFAKWNKPLYEMIRKQAYFRNDALFDRFFADDPRLAKYENYGKKAFFRYALEERVCNSNFNGDIVCYPITDSWSPFCDRELIRILSNRPAEHLADQKIYFDFLKDRFPFLLNTKLDRSFFKPKHFHLYRFGNLLMKAWKRVTPQNNMNPYQVWFEQNPELRQWLGEQYAMLQERYSNEKWLQDLIRYNADSFMGHLQPLTLLLAYDTHFGDQHILQERTGRS